jgi:hypothetical protein
VAVLDVIGEHIFEQVRRAGERLGFVVSEGVRFREVRE